MLVVVFLSAFPPSAAASPTHIFESSFGSAGSGDGQLELGEHSGVAVNDTTHDIYIADTGNHRVDQFDSSGAFIRAFGADVGGSGVNVCSSGCVAGTAGTGPGAFEAPTFVAVDSSPGGEGDVYVADSADGVVSKFTATGVLESSWGTSGQLAGNGTEAFGEIAGIAAGPAGTLYVLGTSSFMFEFEQDGTFIEEFEVAFGTAPAGIAVDSTGDIYKVRGNGMAAKLDPAGSAVIEEIGCESCTVAITVDTSNDDLYAAHSNEVVHYDSGATEIETFGTSAEVTAASGIAIDPGSGSVYVANAAGNIAIFAPPPPEPPVVGALSISNVTSSSADLQAEVNPKFFDTHYHFEYLTREEFEANGETFAGARSTPEADLGSAGTVQIAHVHISGLAADTNYLVRAFAENGNGGPVTSAATVEFRTFPTLPTTLPDGRAYEMVSPSQKLGNVFPPEPGRNLSGTCVFCLPGFDREKMPMQSSPDGKAFVYEGEPFSAGLAAGPNEYLAKRGSGGWQTAGLSLPIFATEEPQGYKAFSSDLSRGVVYQIEPALSPDAPVAEGQSYANLYLWENGEFEPLVTQGPPHRTSGRLPFDTSFKLAYAGANSGTTVTPAFSHVIFSANDSLTAAVPGVAPEAPEAEGSSNCRDLGQSCDLYEWTNGQLRLVDILPGNATTPSGAVFGAGLLNAANATLENQNFDNAISADGSRIFWSDTATGQVYVRIDGDETREIPDPGRFLTASTTGSKVLLADGELYDLESATLTDLTGGLGEFQGILGASDDLSRVYFVDTAALTPPSEANSNPLGPEHAETGEDNLYAWDEGSLTFIGMLDAEDDRVPIGTWNQSPANRAAQVTPDGRYLAFMSTRPLTGYDNTVAPEGEDKEKKTCSIDPGLACSEVFEYDAGADALRCVSCNPTGVRPLGRSNLSLIRGSKEWFQQPEDLVGAGNGRIVFESQDRLSPQDVNGHIQDVYEWEPAGVGSCGVPRGCIFLISSGKDGRDSHFINATPSGADVFFDTRAQLASSDQDEFLDVYDARIGGGFAEGSPPPCGGEACKAPPSSPPELGIIGSTGAGLPGNEVTKRRHRKRHGRHRHHKRRHHRHAKVNRGGAK